MLERGGKRRGRKSEVRVMRVYGGCGWVDYGSEGKVGVELRSVSAVVSWVRTQGVTADRRGARTSDAKDCGAKKSSPR